MDVYGHLFPSLAEALTERLDDVFREARASHVEATPASVVALRCTLSIHTIDDMTEEVSDSTPALVPIFRSDQKLRRSEEHTSEPQSLMRNSYSVLCLNKKQ